MRKITGLIIAIALFQISFGQDLNKETENTIQPNDATQQTIKIHNAVKDYLPFDDTVSFINARKGFMAPLPNIIITDENGKMVWDPNQYAFIKDNSDAPVTVNPSLWRQSKLVAISGLFKVTDRIYQVRNYDLSNITFIEGEKGIIVLDPLISAETAKAGLELYYKNRPQKPIVAVIYSHSHVDHFGGVKGVVSEDDVNSGKVKIYAPKGFLEHALVENVMAGNNMFRRSTYMFGNLLPADEKGQVGAGLGTTASDGTITIIPPTNVIMKDGETHKIDDLTFIFKLAPNSEAPSEMFFYLPELKAMCTADDATHTLHNTYTLRGAKIRDPLAWSKYLNWVIEEYGEDYEILYTPHLWPLWGQDTINHHLELQRDMYRYINDQTLRLANHGKTIIEIAEEIQLPASIDTTFSNRGYYGTVNHDVKSTYVLYLGWFCGNPATLHPLPPVDASKNYVEFMGGADSVLAKAKRSYDKGDYRWVAQVVNHVVFADPTNQQGRYMQADALEQLGYQAESGPWRNFYLTGAQELRNGVAPNPEPNMKNPDMLKAMSIDLLFDYFAMTLNGPKAEGKEITINWTFTDTGEKYVLFLKNSALNHSPNKHHENADATIILKRSTLNKVMAGTKNMKVAVLDGEIKIKGKDKIVHELFGLMDKFEFWFNIVTP